MSEGPETHEPIQLTVEMETSIAAPKTAAASTKETTTQPVDAEIFTETARPRGFGRGKNGLRSTATESKENSRDRMKETKETKERTGDAGDKETKKAPKGADSISRSDEKKSYYQPLPAKGSGGRGSGPKGNKQHQTTIFCCFKSRQVVQPWTFYWRFDSCALQGQRIWRPKV